MNKYRNVKTGAVFVTICECKGGDWELIQAPASPAVTEPVKPEPKEEPEVIEPEKAKPAPRRKKK